jgi:hypothetical protein
VFANRFTAFVDACTLAGALKRNLLLSLAEAEFFRIRWSARVLEETEKAIAKIYEKRGTSQNEAAEHGKRARAKMEIAFEDAMVVGYDHLLPLATNLPGPDDAAAAQIQA